MCCCYWLLTKVKFNIFMLYLLLSTYQPIAWVYVVLVDVKAIH